MTIDSDHFYKEYHGHKVNHLQQLEKQIRPRPIVFFAGDSSLDNKYWIPERSKGLQPFPDPMVEDIAYHLFQELRSESMDFVPLNGSVEEATVDDHLNHRWPQDAWIRDSLQSKDVLIVSIGGNDIALRPKWRTIWNMLLLMYANSNKSLKYATHECYGFPYFVQLFGDLVKEYVQDLVSVTKPKCIMICMIYYPCEKGNGWADRSLNALQYQKDPWKLQRVIQSLFYHATSKITIPGVPVIPVPLYEALDPQQEEDYVARVEPSSIGGRKMAQLFVKKLKALESHRNASSYTINAS
jgi:hypothetical protein